MSNTAPIGVFDSGMGGLTVVREMMSQLPNESIIYFGDTARVPYGPKSPDTVLRYSREITAFLKGEGVKALVVACNTATAHALPALRREFDMPIVGVIEPGARAAAAATKTKRVGVIGTAGTIKSKAYEKEIRKILPDVEVTAQACALFVPLVEEGWLDSEVTRAVARNYLAPIVSAEVDTLVLGCTHYPLMKTVIGNVVGREVRLIDSAHETARQAGEILRAHGLENGAPDGARYRFIASDAPDTFLGLGERFLGSPIDRVETVTLG
ncbi:MAG TPA: glutamate racemase [Gemmatimonadaceae bacterium]|jgi:glutamate racemase|nr:glutamate racemase [Gemmatimonadaceae bacterium]